VQPFHHLLIHQHYFLISFLSSVSYKEHLLAEIEGIRVEKAMQATFNLFPITD